MAAASPEDRNPSHNQPAEPEPSSDEFAQPRDAALRFRYAGTLAESREAVAKLKELLPESSPARDAVVQWVRSRMIATGTKEEHMEQVRELEDLESPIIETIWDRDYRKEGEALGRRATLVRQAERKFGAETAKRLAALLEGISDPERTDPAGATCRSSWCRATIRMRRGQPPAVRRSRWTSGRTLRKPSSIWL